VSDKNETVVAHKAVEIHYTLTNDAGEVVDSSRDTDPLPYIHGTESLVPGLEKELDGKAVGDKVVTSIPPKEGYGELNPELTQSVPRDLFEFDGDIEIGMRFEAEAENGVELVTVVGLDDKTITIDGNHPLAGQTLNFDVEVMSIREATSEELEHGHIHSEGGCGH